MFILGTLVRSGPENLSTKPALVGHAEMRTVKIDCVGCPRSSDAVEMTDVCE